MDTCPVVRNQPLHLVIRLFFYRFHLTYSDFPLYVLESDWRIGCAQLFCKNGNRACWSRRGLGDG